MPAVHLRTNGKINLFLRVLSARPDGYHEVETVLHGVGLADDVDVDARGGGIEIDMALADGPGSGLPAAHENIVARVVERLRERARAAPGASIRIRKRIPIGSGLGGGSANAAGVLLALDELWSLHLDRAALLEVAASLGSDVPYCLRGGTALATARGEDVRPLPPPRPMWFVLGLSRGPLLTRDVYDVWDRLASAGDASSSSLVFALARGGAGDVASHLRNDLEPAVFALRPELRERKASLVAAGALGACVSGSGPTIYGIARDRAHAREVAALAASHFESVVVAPSRAECVERIGDK